MDQLKFHSCDIISLISNIFGKNQHFSSFLYEISQVKSFGRKETEKMWDVLENFFSCFKSSELDVNNSAMC